MIRLLVLPVLTIAMAVSLSVDKSVSTPESEIAYPEDLTGSFTGGFGEETCRSCHFDYDLNPEGGTLTVSGISKTIHNGDSVNIVITVKRKDLGRAGFQLSARYENGSQAGYFDIADKSSVMFSEAVADSLQYVQHSSSGSKVGNEEQNSWTVKWIAPKKRDESVIFNITANAANGDQSEFGDFIYAKEIKVDLSGN
jgi:hypothetical protein